MQGDRRSGLISRFFRVRRRVSNPVGGGEPLASADTVAGLSAAELEQAYRNLLMENLVLAESNRRMLENLPERDSGPADALAQRRLVQSLRNELAERSNRLRQLEYDNKRLERAHKRIAEHHQRLLGERSTRQVELERLRGELAVRTQELADTKCLLRDKGAALLQLTDRCVQLEARLQERLAVRSAANGEF